MPSSRDRREPIAGLNSGQVGTGAGPQPDEPRRSGNRNTSVPRQPEAPRNREDRVTPPSSDADADAAHRKKRRPSRPLSLSSWRLERAGSGTRSDKAKSFHAATTIPGLLSRLRHQLAHQHRRLLRSSRRGSSAGGGSAVSASPPALRLPAELLLLVSEYLRYRDAWALKHTCRYFFRVVDLPQKPKIPQTLAAWWDDKLVLYHTVVLGWRADDTARSLLWGVNPSVYNPLLEEDRLLKQFVVDGHATLLHIVPEGNQQLGQQPQPQPQPQPQVHHPQAHQHDQVLAPGPLDGVVNAAAGVIVTYSPLARVTFDAATERCRALRARFDSKGVEVPVLLLSVSTPANAAANSGPNPLSADPLDPDLSAIGPRRREVDSQEALEMAHSLGVGHCEVEIGGAASDVDADVEAGAGVGTPPFATPWKPVDEPFVEIIRMIRRATDEYVGARMSQQNFGAAWRKRLVVRPAKKR